MITGAKAVFELFVHGYGRGLLTIGYLRELCLALGRLLVRSLCLAVLSPSLSFFVINVFFLSHASILAFLGDMWARLCVWRWTHGSASIFPSISARNVTIILQNLFLLPQLVYINCLKAILNPRTVQNDGQDICGALSGNRMSKPFLVIMLIDSLYPKRQHCHFTSLLTTQNFQYADKCPAPQSLYAQPSHHLSPQHPS